MSCCNRNCDEGRRCPKRAPRELTVREARWLCVLALAAFWVLVWRAWA